ncbi:hypothetical protein DRW48_02110 [Paracoccus suum]|uniref:YIP1 family protein n=1 Tax=Paracoccus suum TaxID=2259340 RepID=A0A344PGY9_9RHOB|nr:hypothetical protein [Paracoccus suum]AXC48644.1 hypothetical protein DRW48_02110 [Paracoccus suum]
MRPAPPRAARGLAPRVLESWFAPGRVVRGLRGMPEGALLALLLAALLVFLIAQAPGHARAAALDPGIPLGPRLAGAGLAVMFLMPLAAYGAAQALSWLLRLGGWVLHPADSRLALFWALLAVAPAMLLAGLTEGLVGPGPALTATRLLAGTGFLFIWLSGVRALIERPGK